MVTLVKMGWLILCRFAGGGVDSIQMPWFTFDLDFVTV